MSAFAVIAVASCRYLDVVPPEQPDLDDMMVDEATTTKMLYSCYSYAQNNASMQLSSNLDMRADEYVTPQEWENYGSSTVGCHNSVFHKRGQWICLENMV